MQVHVAVATARPQRAPSRSPLTGEPQDLGDRPGRTTARALVHRLGLGPVSATCRTCGGPHGRPTVAGAWVSFSYAGDLVAVAVCAVPVGVDVERAAATCFEGFPGVALAPGEPDTDRAASWTRKEAVLKATGDGLAVDPRSVVVTGGRVRWAAAPGPIALADLSVPVGWAGAVAALTAEPLDVVAVDGEALLAGTAPPVRR